MDHRSPLDSHYKRPIGRSERPSNQGLTSSLTSGIGAGGMRSVTTLTETCQEGERLETADSAFNVH